MVLHKAKHPEGSARHGLTQKIRPGDGGEVLTTFYLCLVLSLQHIPQRAVRTSPRSNSDPLAYRGGPYQYFY